MTIEDLSRDNVGRFDVALCFGILYHLEDPVRAMKGLASVTRRVMVVDTDVVRLGGVLPFVRSEPLWLMSVVQPGGSEEETTNLWRQGASCQFRPTAQAVEKLLWFLGFGEVRRLKPTEKGLERRYYKGTRATFIAVR